MPIRARLPPLLVLDLVLVIVILITFVQKHSEIVRKKNFVQKISSLILLTVVVKLKGFENNDFLGGNL